MSAFVLRTELCHNCVTYPRNPPVDIVIYEDTPTRKEVGELVDAKVSGAFCCAPLRAGESTSKRATFKLRRQFQRRRGFKSCLADHGAGTVVAIELLSKGFAGACNQH